MTINSAVREHETTMEWDYQPLSKLLYSAIDLFNREYFGGHLEGCILTFDPINVKTFVHGSGCDLNGIGAENEIVINVKHLWRPRYHVLAAIAHGMTHQWLGFLGRSGDGKYHNREFRRKSIEIGLPCETGYHCEVLEYQSEFYTVVNQLECDLDAQAMEMEPPPEMEEELEDLDEMAPALLKWRCGCMDVWAVERITGHCDSCTAAYALAAGD